MKKPEPAPPAVLTPENARKALAIDLENLLRKVKSGKPLTRYERTLVEAKSAHREAAAVAPPLLTFANSQAELAKQLAVSRQVIHYHTRQPGNPGRRADGRYPVMEWRSYLQAVGRLPMPSTTTTTAPATQGGRPRTRLDFGDGIEALLDRTGERLPRIVEVALLDAGIKSTPEQRDRLTTTMFLMVAAQADRLCTIWGFPSVFEADENGEGPYPPAIREAAARIASGLPTSQDLPPPNLPAHPIKTPVIES